MDRYNDTRRPRTRAERAWLIGSLVLTAAVISLLVWLPPLSAWSIIGVLVLIAAVGVWISIKGHDARVRDR